MDRFSVDGSLTAYAVAVDDGDWEGYRRLFAPEDAPTTARPAASSRVTPTEVARSARAEHGPLPHAPASDRQPAAPVRVLDQDTGDTAEVRRTTSIRCGSRGRTATPPRPTSCAAAATPSACCAPTTAGGCARWSSRRNGAGCHSPGTHPRTPESPARSLPPGSRPASAPREAGHRRVSARPRPPTPSDHHAPCRRSPPTRTLETPRGREAKDEQARPCVRPMAGLPLAARRRRRAGRRAADARVPRPVAVVVRVRGAGALDPAGALRPDGAACRATTAGSAAPGSCWPCTTGCCRA